MADRIGPIQLILALLVLADCGGQPTPTPDLVATEVAVQRAAIATLTAEAPAPTRTASPTSTPTHMPTATTTEMPTPTETATHTATPVLPTPTPMTPPTIDVDPSSIALTLEDLPAGFYVDENETGPTSNRQIADTHPNPDEYSELLTQWGGVSGWRASFSRDPSLGTLMQVQMIDNIVSIYQSAEGARLAMQYQPAELPPEARQVSVPRLGDQTQGYMLELTTQELTAVGYMLHLRVLSVLVSVRVIGLQGGISLDDAIPLAEIVLGRLGR